MYYGRALQKRWLKASESFPVLLLTGPRQVGKTTMLKNIREKKRKYVSLDDLSLRMLAKEDPVLFLKQYSPPVIIDEIQYAPELMPYIKIAVDSSGGKGEYWLTGSQQFQMMKGVTETLAGRVAIVNMLGFSLREKSAGRMNLMLPPFTPDDATLKTRRSSSDRPMKKDISVDIWRGSFPALVENPGTDRDIYFSSYLQTYIQRDVRDLTQVGNLQAFTTFLKVCAARTGQLLNISDIARDSNISIPTAKNWLSILEASCQIFLLYPFHSNITKRLTKTPKLYFLDTGFCSYLTGWSSPETLFNGAMSGHIFETFVFTEILKSWWNSIRTPQIFYYRDKDCREIDLLILKDNTIYPVEIKKSATVKGEWARHFDAISRFSEEKGNGAVICMSSEEVPLRPGVMAIPVSYI
ncbi:MAG TPA: ATPase [Lentisphaeria bacterium]|nr:MAG: ATPase [Lentisphaerae bacterium GWF2_49_21]HBC87213.1 ATPase [Lentisphaeria bacterium]